MTDRAIVARLRAEAAGFIATMGKAAKSVGQVGEEADRTSKRAGSAFTRTAKAVAPLKGDIDTLGNAALVAGGLIATGLGFAVKAFADFDQAMSAASAALPDAGAKMQDLRALAIQLGKDTQYSATEAAQGIAAMAKAGVSAEDILGGGLAGALNLAAAGQMEVAAASELAATALNQFGLSGKDLGRVADLYAAAAGKAQGSVQDIGLAMKYVGPVAKSMGLSIEETTGVVAEFAAKGILGEQAGTSFRAMLLSLTAPSRIAAKALDEYGISIYDTNGNMLSMAGIADQLQAGLGGLDEATRNQALGQIFGNESMAAAITLYEGGGAAVQEWTNKVDDAGFAAEQAAKLTDNLKGDLERLGGTIDTVLIQNGEGANGALRSLVQSVEDGIEAFGNLPAPIQQGVVKFAAITAGGLLAVGAFAKIVTTGSDVIGALSAIRERGGKAAKGLDAAGKAAKVAGVAFVGLMVAGAVSDAVDDMAIGVEQLTNTLIKAPDSVAALNAKLRESGGYIDSFGTVLSTAFDDSAAAGIERVGDSLGQMLGATSHSAQAGAAKVLDEIDQSLSNLVSSGNAEEAARVFQQLTAEAEAQGIGIDQLKSKLPQYGEALAAADTQQRTATTTAVTLTDGMKTLSGGAQDAKGDVEELADAIRGFGSATLDVRDAQRDFQAAVDDASAAVKENGKGLDVSTEKGRANQATLDAIAQSTLDYSAATLTATGSASDAAKVVEQGRAAFIRQAIDMGMSKEAAKKLADQLGLIPEDVTSVVKIEGTQQVIDAVRVMREKLKALDGTIARVGVRYVVSGQDLSGSRSTSGGLTFDADGGVHSRRGGMLVKEYADGGTFHGQMPRIAKAGGRGIVWAEEGAGPWEAFISGHPAKRGRSRLIAEDTVQRLGGQVSWQRFASGGMFTPGPASTPASSSTTSYGPIHVTLDAAGIQSIRTLEDFLSVLDARVGMRVGGRR